MKEDINNSSIISPYSKIYGVPIEQHCGAQLASYFLRDVISKFSDGEEQMRCEHCIWRYSWDCEDCWISDNSMCENFKLDFDTLTNAQKKEIQKRLMERTR